MNGGGALGGKLAAVALAADGEVTLTLTSWDPSAVVPPAEPATADGTTDDTGAVTARTVDRLRELAGRFAAATADEAHDLFADAFGLYGARHFGIAPEPHRADLGEVSWWHGPTVGQRSLPGARRARRAARAVRGAAASAVAGRHRKPEPAAATGPAALAAERRAAARMLLAHPLVTATGPHAQAFPLICRHADWLTGRFAELLGYPLTVTGTFARLTKAALGPTAPRRLSVAGTPCTPGQYAALAGALATLLTGPIRRPGTELAAELTAELTVRPAAEPADEAESAASGERADDTVSAVLEVLTRWQVLTEEAPAGVFVVDRELLGAVLAGCCPARPQDPPPPRTTIPVAVRRRLVETPVVLFEELTGLEREWLWESRAREAGVFADFLGLTTEIRREGIALLDPAGELTDLRLPGPGPLAHAALLLVERLVDELRPLPAEEPGTRAQQPTPPSGVPIAEALIDGILGDLADQYDTDDRVREQHVAHWRRAHLADRAAFRREVLALLHAMRLIAPSTPDGGCGTARGGWRLLAPAARYAAPLELGETGGTGRHSRR